jgi:CheY-like chemotaxis protein
LGLTHPWLPGAFGFRPGFLTGIGMPVLDGYEVPRRLRQVPGTRDALIWALTGHGREEDRQRALEVGCDLHLVKPFPPQGDARRS